MSKNYMADVAKMLGVEVGDEFEACGCGTFMFSDVGLEYKDSDGNWQDSPSTLALLINGVVEIKKNQWKPKENEIYYLICTDGSIEMTRFWHSLIEDMLNIRTGNFFKTREEAEANVDKWLKYIKQEPDVSWRVK